MKRTLTKVWNIYTHSWKHLLSLRALWIILTDSAFYLALFLLSTGMTGVIANIAKGVQPGLLEDVAKVYIVKILVAIIGLVIVSWAIWTISRAIIWQLLANERFTKKVWMKFFGFNLIWTIVMVLPIYVLVRHALSVLGPGVAPSKNLIMMHYVLVLVLLYFGYNVFYAFIKEKKVFAAYKVGLKRSFINIGYQLPAFLALVATILVIGKLNPLIAKLPTTLGLAVSYLAFFGSLTWAKIYYYAVLSAGKEPHRKKAHKKHSKKK